MYDYLIRNSGLQWTKKFCVAMEIAKGLKYLHENNIAHLDLVCEEKMLVVSFVMPENVSFSSSIIREKPVYTEPQCLKDPIEIPVKDTPPEYEQLYKLCWDEDPEKRPSIILVLS
ncbi:kinase-like protein [Gigaspora margarita]|uniref:Kinase-like protein n=1 Tax=Gigaspora margarita TaxID=4874 RepID=A0A8H4AII6_GIGMA|nr:kinase-like protein [Gigaspora margarita]